MSELDQALDNAPNRVWMLPLNSDRSHWPKKVWPEPLPCETVEFINASLVDELAQRAEATINNHCPEPKFFCSTCWPLQEVLERLKEVRGNG